MYSVSPAERDSIPFSVVGVALNKKTGFASEPVAATQYEAPEPPGSTSSSSAPARAGPAMAPANRMATTDHRHCRRIRVARVMNPRFRPRALGGAGAGGGQAEPGRAAARRER